MAIKISGTTVIDDSRNFTNIQEINGLDYPASDGSAGQVLTTDGAGSLSLQDLPPSGPTVEAVASGTLPDGSPVVVNSDGTVSSISETQEFVLSPGTPTVYYSDHIDTISSVYDPSTGKIVVAYQDYSPSPRRVVATVGELSGGSLSFGSVVEIAPDGGQSITLTFDSNENAVVVFFDDGANSDFGTARVGTVSGSSISFGTPTVFESARAIFKTTAATFDSSSNKVVIAYADAGDARKNKACVGAVSGSSISFGSPVQFDSGNLTSHSAVFDPSSNKVVIAWSGNAPGYAVAGTVSGTSISFGSRQTFESEAVIDPSATFDSNSNKIIIAYKYQDPNDSSRTNRVVIADVDSSSSITFGTPVVYNSARGDFPSVVYDSNSTSFFISYADYSGAVSAVPTVIQGTVDSSQLSATFNDPVVVDNVSSPNHVLVLDSDENEVIILYEDENNSSYGTAVKVTDIISVTNLTSENFIGFSDASYSDTQTATIQALGSVNNSQTGLNTAQSHFVQADGTLAETPGEPEVFAGTAMSSNKIIVKG